MSIVGAREIVQVAIIEVEIDAEDQNVEVGSSLLYQPEIRDQLFNFKYEVDLDLGDASDFTFYDAILNTFNVYGDKTLDSDVGDYRIEISTRIFNETFSVIQ